jgi:hypothetical protein
MTREFDELVDAVESTHQLRCPRQSQQGDVRAGKSGSQRPQGRRGAEHVAQHQGAKDDDPPDRRTGDG